jgi:hypothetical protein
MRRCLGSKRCYPRTNTRFTIAKRRGIGKEFTVRLSPAVAVTWRLRSINPFPTSTHSSVVGPLTELFSDSTRTTKVDKSQSASKSTRFLVELSILVTSIHHSFAFNVRFRALATTNQRFFTYHLGLSRFLFAVRGLSGYPQKAAYTSDLGVDFLHVRYNNEQCRSQTELA